MHSGENTFFWSLVWPDRDSNTQFTVLEGSTLIITPPVWLLFDWLVLILLYIFKMCSRNHSFNRLINLFGKHLSDDGFGFGTWLNITLKQRLFDEFQQEWWSNMENSSKRLSYKVWIWTVFRYSTYNNRITFCKWEKIISCFSIFSFLWSVFS
jgi:hypothetical protein